MTGHCTSSDNKLEFFFPGNRLQNVIFGKIVFEIFESNCTLAVSVTVEGTSLTETDSCCVLLVINVVAVFAESKSVDLPDSYPLFWSVGKSLFLVVDTHL